MAVDYLKVGEEICEVWGLDPLRVTNLTLNIHAGRPPTVTVTLIEHEDWGFERLIEVLKKYTLTEVDE